MPFDDIIFRLILTDLEQLISMNFARSWLNFDYTKYCLKLLNKLYTLHTLININKNSLTLYRLAWSANVWVWTYWISSITRSIKYQILIFQADDKTVRLERRSVGAGPGLGYSINEFWWLSVYGARWDGDSLSGPTHTSILCCPSCSLVQ